MFGGHKILWSKFLTGSVFTVYTNIEFINILNFLLFQFFL